MHYRHHLPLIATKYRFSHTKSFQSTQNGYSQIPVFVFQLIKQTVLESRNTETTYTNLLNTTYPQAPQASCLPHHTFFTLFFAKNRNSLLFSPRKRWLISLFSNKTPLYPLNKPIFSFIHPHSLARAIHSARSPIIPESNNKKQSL